MHDCIPDYEIVVPALKGKYYYGHEFRMSVETTFIAFNLNAIMALLKSHVVSCGTRQSSLSARRAAVYFIAEGLSFNPWTCRESVLAQRPSQQHKLRLRCRLRAR